MTSCFTIYDTPLGPLTLRGGPAGLTALEFDGGGVPDRDPGHLATAIEQLDEYFGGRRDRFDVALDLGGTPFQRAVWQRLVEIPRGFTTTYRELAQALGRPRAARAVGAAVGRTPVPIFVPCHRVVGSDGSLTGYRGGLERKRALLEHERAG